MAHDFHPNLDDTFRRARSYGRASGFAFVDRGGMPSVRVVPVAALVAVVATAWFSLLAAVATLVAAPLVLYRGWWGRFRQHEEPEFLAYPYLMAAEDVVTNWGFLQGWRRRRRSAR